MLKDNQLVGAIAIYRQEVRPFTDKQIELVQNFAAQAVIAIENTRLLNELRQRTDDLPSRWSSRPRPREVLKVISSSPGELEPVFQAMLENAVAHLRAPSSATLLLCEGDGVPRRQPCTTCRRARGLCASDSAIRSLRRHRVPLGQRRDEQSRWSTSLTSCRPAYARP